MSGPHNPGPGPRFRQPGANDDSARPGRAARTTSGLARRVRGAQMPVPDPRAVTRRAYDVDDAGHRSADEVYWFLSSFTAGVQRARQAGRGRREAGDLA
jgi:hypothetical protein